VLAAHGIAPAGAQELSYHLPRGTALGGYKWQLKKCPTADDPSVIVSSGPSIKGNYDKGELVRLDPRSPFLGSRKISLTFHENGTIKTINAEGEGKGGAIIAGLLKTATGFAGVVFPITESTGAKPRLQGECTGPIFSLVDRWTKVSDRIEKVQGRIAAGEVLVGAQKALYDNDLKEEAELSKALTITVAAKGLEALPTAEDGKVLTETHAVTQPDFGPWFVGDTTGMIEEAPHMCVRYSVKQSDLAEARPLVRGGTPDLGELQGKFLYRRPVPVFVELLPAGPGAGGATDCKLIPAKAVAIDKRTIALPQLSGSYLTLPIGSGAFESKAVAAEFTPEGRIVSMSYTGAGAGASIADALAGGLAAAQTLRDADLVETKREIEKIKAENELEALREAAEAAPS
jgi:hypothetical protein